MEFITKNKIAIAVNLAAISSLVYILASTPPATGYEVSIYDAYPIVFWVLYFVLYLFNIVFIFIVNNKRATLIGLLGVLASVLILTLLPLQRDYFCIDGGDSLSHLTYIKNFVYEGRLGLYMGIVDPYPLSHILTAGLIWIGLNIQDSIQVMPSLYYIWFVIFMYLLARHLLKDNRAVAILMLLTLLPILAINHYYPSLFFVYLLPALFYFVVKRWWIPAIVVVITLPVTHPASSLLLLIFMVLLGLLLYSQGYQLSGKWCVGIVITFILVWGAWLLVLDTQIASLVGRPLEVLGLTEDAPPSKFSVIMSGIAVSDMNLGELFLLYIKRYGQMHLVMGLGIAGSISVIYLWARRKLAQPIALTFSMLCLIYCALYLTSFFVSEYIILGRIYTFALVISAFPATILLCELIKRHKAYMGIIVALLLVTNFFAVLTLYDSPFNKKPPQQITMSEINAVTWVLENKEPGEKVYGLLRKQRRMANYILGRDYRGNDKLEGLDAKGLPTHFGYDNYETLGEALGNDCYLITNTKNIEVSTKVYPEYEDIWAYHPDDYEKLNNDNTLTLVFEDGGVKVYQVEGIK